MPSQSGLMRATTGAGAQIEEPLSGGGRAAHHGVDKSPDGALPQLHRFKDRGVVRELEDQKLAEAHAQDIARFVVQLPLPQFPDPMVEQPEIPQHAQHDGIQEGTVRRGEVVAGCMPFDQVFGIGVPFRPGPEDGDGGAAG